MHLCTYSRDTTSLDGVWQAIPDAYEYFEHYGITEPEDTNPERPDNFTVDDGWSLRVPASVGAELPELEYYEGLVWHARRVSWDGEGERVFLKFGAVNYEADVWLNGEYLGHHEGGFTPFSFEVTDAVEESEENLLVVGVDNRHDDETIPTGLTDWFNFGGINRSVELLCVPETFVRNFKIETTVSDEAVEVSARAWTDGPETDDALTLTVPGLGVERGLKPDSERAYSGSFVVDRDDVRLWSPDDPSLYEVRLSHAADELRDRVGFREVTVEGSDVLVNGDPVYLRGISLHEEANGKGRALDEGDVEERFEWLGQLGCNFARLAHYPHTEMMARKADEEGVLLWEEVPAYWGIAFGDEDVQALYRQQLRELVERDWNRASVVLWSVANETNHEDDTRNDVLPEMVEHVRGVDDTRLVTAACFVDEADDDRFEIHDPLADQLDVVGINEYQGWYEGEADDMARFADDPDGTPVVISETGGGAKWGHHGDDEEVWTEENQARIYREQLRALDEHDQVVGFSPWILFDFRTPLRMNEYQRGFNRKGLVDPQGHKKQAFEVLRDFYSETARTEASSSR